MHERVMALKDELEQIRVEEEDALSNMPDSLQNSSRGESMQEAIEGMESVETDLDSATDALANLAERK